MNSLFSYIQFCTDFMFNSKLKLGIAIFCQVFRAWEVADIHGQFHVSRGARGIEENFARPPSPESLSLPPSPSRLKADGMECSRAASHVENDDVRARAFDIFYFFTKLYGSYISYIVQIMTRLFLILIISVLRALQTLLLQLQLQLV